MPTGKGSYNKKVGRPPDKKKVEKKKVDKKKAKK